MNNKSLRHLVRQFIVEYMTTTPAASWSTATPLGKCDDDPWGVDEERGSFEPARNMGGHTGGNEDHTRLGDDEDVSVFHDEEPDESDAGNYWEKNYYSNPMMQRDR